MKGTILLAVLVLAGFILTSCKAPDSTTAGPKDSTSNMEKKAGGGDE